MQGILGPFRVMQDDLAKEKRATERQWAKRQKQIDLAITGAAGMYGDFQGIIGGSLPEIEGASLLALSADEPVGSEENAQLGAR